MVRSLSKGQQLLLKVLHEKDKRALKELIDICYLPLSRYAFSLLRSEADALDIVQELFFYIWTEGEKIDFKPPGSAFRFLCVIVYRRCMDFFQHRRRRPVPIGVVDHNPVDEAPIRDAHQHEIASVISNAVHELRKPHRDVAILRLYSGMDNEAIAGFLGVPEGTVASRLSNAMKSIGSKLKGLFNERY